MSDQYTSGPLLDMFIFETNQLLEQLEACILDTEQTGSYSQDAINEIFRIMHTIKGSSTMMRYDNISALAHSMEDLFYFLREEKPKEVHASTLSDLLLEDVDFIKAQIIKIKAGSTSDSDASKLINNNRNYLSKLKASNADIKLKAPDVFPSNASSGRKYANSFKAVIYFQEGCEMENIRAYAVIHNLEEVAGEIRHIPENILDEETVPIIRRDGFTVFLKTDFSYIDIHQLLMQTVFLKELELEQLNHEEASQAAVESDGKLQNDQEQLKVKTLPVQQSIISVTVSKLDKLMDLVGEFVIAEAMVIHNPDLKGLVMENFQKASRQLHKITSELQDVVMSIRMIPLSSSFQKMSRIVRDMSKKLGKEVRLKIIGEETEVDKNVIEHLSDPLMHLVRNAIDHGIEPPADRVNNGKPEYGTITLEAKNSGSDVLIIVRDDGKGLDREKILRKAIKQGLLTKPEEEMSEKEINNLIFHPGFSTMEEVTEFSGRGVGMDAVTKNIEKIGGVVSVDSIPGQGSVFTIKIPLTLAIIDGMNIRVGSSYYTIPTISIRESFRPAEDSIFADPDNNEMIMVRGQCYPILRLYELFKKDTSIKKLSEGILIMCEQDEKTVCLFADELIGQQQVVVKVLPEYIRNYLRAKRFSGCTLLGDGSISLILDLSGIINIYAQKVKGEMLRMENVNNNTGQMEEDTQKDRYLTFIIGSESYGIGVRYVTEITGMQPITGVPELPEYINGIINLRGQIIPVMDVRIRFKKEPKEYTDRTCIIIVNIEHLRMGLIVDRVSEVITIPEQDIVEPPQANLSAGSRYIHKIGKVGSDVTLLLDCKKLLTEEELEDISETIQ